MKRLAEATLHVEALSCGFPGRTVLSSATFDAHPGAITALLGANGSGKTTLLRTISGALKPLGGRIKFGANPLESLSDRDRAKAVGYVPQSTSPRFAFTVREFVALGRLPHSEGLFETREDWLAIEEALGKADCVELQNRPVTEISGGELQRVLIARALAQDPAILLLDEPSAHLDLPHHAELIRLATSLASERRILILALHDLNLAAAIADRCLVLHKGSIALQGTPNELFDSHQLDELYGVRLERIRTPSGRVVISPNFLHAGEPHFLSL